MDLGPAKLKRTGINQLKAAFDTDLGLAWTDGEVVYLVPSDVATGRKPYDDSSTSVVGQLDDVNSLHWSHREHTHLAVVSRSKVTLVKFQDGVRHCKQVAELEVNSPIQDLLWHPGGNSFAVLCRNKLQVYSKGHVRHVHHTTKLHTCYQQPLSNGKCMCVTPDGAGIAVADDCTVQIFSWKNGSRGGTVENSVKLPGAIVSINCSAEGTIVCATELPLERLCSNAKEDWFTMPDVIANSAPLVDGQGDILRPAAQSGTSVTESLFNLHNNQRNISSAAAQLVVIACGEDNAMHVSHSIGITGVVSPDLLCSQGHLVAVASNTQSKIHVYQMHAGKLQYCRQIVLERDDDKSCRPKGMTFIAGRSGTDNGMETSQSPGNVSGCPGNESGCLGTCRQAPGNERDCPGTCRQVPGRAPGCAELLVMVGQVGNSEVAFLPSSAVATYDLKLKTFSVQSVLDTHTDGMMTEQKSSVEMQVQEHNKRCLQAEDCPAHHGGKKICDHGDQTDTVQQELNGKENCEDSVKSFSMTVTVDNLLLPNGQTLSKPQQSNLIQEYTPDTGQSTASEDSHAGNGSENPHTPDVKVVEDGCNTAGVPSSENNEMDCDKANAPSNNLVNSELSFPQTLDTRTDKQMAMPNITHSPSSESDNTGSKVSVLQSTEMDVSETVEKTNSKLNNASASADYEEESKITECPVHTDNQVFSSKEPSFRKGPKYEMFKLRESMGPISTWTDKGLKKLLSIPKDITLPGEEGEESDTASSHQGEAPASPSLSEMGSEFHSCHGYKDNVEGSSHGSASSDYSSEDSEQSLQQPRVEHARQSVRGQQCFYNSWEPALPYPYLDKAESVTLTFMNTDGTSERSHHFILDRGRLKASLVKNVFHLNTLQFKIDDKLHFVDGDKDGYIPVRFRDKSTVEIGGSVK